MAPQTVHLTPSITDPTLERPEQAAGFDVEPSTSAEPYSGGGTIGKRQVGPGQPPMSSGWSLAGGSISPNSAGMDATSYAKALAERGYSQGKMSTGV